MADFIDNKEINEVMEILEEMADEELAVSLLKELNEKTKALGTLIVNRDKALDHAEWKTQADDAKKQVDDLVAKIRSCK